MSLAQLLQKRLSDQGPVRIGLIDAGKFGSMFLSQVPTTPGLEVTVIADLDPQRTYRKFKLIFASAPSVVSPQRHAGVANDGAPRGPSAPPRASGAVRR